MKSLQIKVAEQTDKLNKDLHKSLQQIKLMQPKKANRGETATCATPKKTQRQRFKEYTKTDTKRKQQPAITTEKHSKENHNRKLQISSNNSFKQPKRSISNTNLAQHKQNKSR
jgi:hypothetical protein